MYWPELRSIFATCFLLQLYRRDFYTWRAKKHVVIQRPERVKSCLMPPANPTAGKRPSSDGRTCPLYLGLFCQFQRIIDLYSQISYGAFKLRVAKQELHGPKVFRPPVHQ